MDCRVLPTLAFQEEYNIMLPLYRKKVHRKVIGKWYCQILSAGSQLNTIELLQTGLVCVYYYISFLHARNNGRQKCMIIFHIYSGYYPAKVHVALVQFWRWCRLEVVFANGWVPLLIVVTRPSGGHCRQSWAILGRSRCQQSQLPPVTSFLLQNWKLVKYIYIYFFFLWFSSSWFPSCFFSWSSFSQMIVAVTPPNTDMKEIHRVGVSCCQIDSVKSSSWDWGLRVDVIDPLIH